TVPVHHLKVLQLTEVLLEAGHGCTARIENTTDLSNDLLDSGADVKMCINEEADKLRLVLSRPVMERRGYSVNAILARVCAT
ncbi:hypothetical protein JG688_00009722, partial [Phytophthora aleatoria]